MPYILDTNGEVIGIIENVVPKTRPPLKLPRIHSSVDREGIDQEKECLLDTVSNNRPHQSHYQLIYIHFRTNNPHQEEKIKKGNSPPHNKLTENFHTLQDQRTHANYYLYIYFGTKNHKFTNIYILQGHKLQNNCYLYITGPKTAK